MGRRECLNWDSCDLGIAMIEKRGLPVRCRRSNEWITSAIEIPLPVAILYAISMNVPAEQDAPPTMWVGIVREDYVQRTAPRHYL